MSAVISNYGPIEAWDVSAVEDFSWLFVDSSNSALPGAHSFNEDVSDWDVSSGTDFTGMFLEARAFNVDISRWDVSSGQTFGDMFRECDMLFRNGGLGVANDNCCVCNPYHTKLWGGQSILITPNNTFDDCVDTPNWEDKDGRGCDAYEEYCPESSDFESNGYYDSDAEEEFLRHVASVRENCCACGGGSTSLRSNSIIIRNAIDSNVCLAKDETYRFQVRAHGWGSVDGTLGHNTLAYALSSNEDQFACGQFEIDDVSSRLQSNFTAIVTVDPTSNSTTGCTALDGGDNGRGIELLPLKCYYDSLDDGGLLTRNNAWKGACSETSRLDSSCSSSYRIGLDESEEYCKFEEYHQFVSDVGDGAPFSPSSAQGECLWEVWDYDFGTRDRARTKIATCCRSGFERDEGLVTLS